MEFWISPTSEEAYNFITKFKLHIDQISSKIEFEPKYKFKNLIKKMSESFLKDNCFSKGKYCVAEKEVFDATSVLIEGIRQICIWDLSKKGELDKEFWWSYIFHYRDCLKAKIHSKTPSQKHCFDSISDILGITSLVISKLDSCIQSSFTDSEDKFGSENKLLEAHLNPYEYSDIYLVPAVFINNQLVKEDLNAKVVLSAVCEVLKERPDACDVLNVSNIKWEHEKQILGDYKFIKVCLLWGMILAAFTFILYVVRMVVTTNVNEEINNEIRDHVIEYMRIKEFKNDTSFSSKLELNN